MKIIVKPHPLNPQRGYEVILTESVHNPAHHVIYEGDDASAKIVYRSTVSKAWHVLKAAEKCKNIKEKIWLIKLGLLLVKQAKRSLEKVDKVQEVVLL